MARFAGSIALNMAAFVEANVLISTSTRVLYFSPEYLFYVMSTGKTCQTASVHLFVV